MLRFVFCWKPHSEGFNTIQKYHQNSPKSLKKTGLKIGEKQGSVSGLLGSSTHDRATMHGQCSLNVRALNYETLSLCLTT